MLKGFDLDSNRRSEIIANLTLLKGDVSKGIHHKDECPYDMMVLIQALCLIMTGDFQTFQAQFGAYRPEFRLVSVSGEQHKVFIRQTKIIKHLICLAKRGLCPYDPDRINEALVVIRSWSLQEEKLERAA